MFKLLGMFTNYVFSGKTCSCSNLTWSGDSQTETLYREEERNVYSCNLI